MQHRLVLLLASGCLGLLSGCVTPSEGRGARVPADTLSAGPAASPRAVSPTDEGLCDLVCGQHRLVARPEGLPDYTQQEIDDADRVLTDLRPKLLACYTQRLRANPAAHGFITMDLVVDHEGRVSHVDTTGGAVLGPRTMSCLVHIVEGAQFAPPHGGGNMFLHVPFNLQRTADGETT
jgi:hypothetical protein